ncbi:MAG: RIO1 family regulatory kinase/ATPase, partial [Chloroflexota bacterium]
ITLIDFPQVVSPDGNPAAWLIFRRDVTRVCQYFAVQGVPCDPYKLSTDLWTAHGHRIVRPVDPHYLDAENLGDRKIWEQQR